MRRDRTLQSSITGPPLQLYKFCPVLQLCKVIYNTFKGKGVWASSIQTNMAASIYTIYKVAIDNNLNHGFAKCPYEPLRDTLQLAK